MVGIKWCYEQDARFLLCPTLTGTHTHTHTHTRTDRHTQIDSLTQRHTHTYACIFIDLHKVLICAPYAWVFLAPSPFLAL